MLRYLPKALYLIACDIARAHGRRMAANLARAAIWLVLLAPFTLAAPQMTPAQIEREFQVVHGKLATLEDLTRATQKATEVAIAQLKLHEESGRSHSQYAAQLEALAIIQQAHTLRFAEVDAVVLFIKWAIGIMLALLTIFVSIALSIRSGHKKVVDEHHEICEILRGMNARMTSRKHAAS